MSDKTRDRCYQSYQSEPDIRFRLELNRLLQSMLEDEANELQKKMNGPEIPWATEVMR